MNMTSVYFIKFMTNYVFPEPEGPPTIHVIDISISILPYTGMTEGHYTVCDGSCCVYL